MFTPEQYLHCLLKRKVNICCELLGVIFFNYLVKYGTIDINLSSQLFRCKDQNNFLISKYFFNLFY